MLEQLVCFIRDSFDLLNQRGSLLASPELIVLTRPHSWNNLDDRANQQETKFYLGSSETTRRASWIFLNTTNYFHIYSSLFFMKSHTSSYNFASYLDLAPTHKKFQSVDFLEWFLGFAEGDGSFTTHSGRPIFMLNQADLAVLRKIRTELGFGTVGVFEQNERIYGRYVVRNRAGIERLISLFNGNIHLPKVHRRFVQWVERYNQIAKTDFLVQPCRSLSTLTLDSAWVSGFFDAEGGFSASVRREPRNKCGYRLTFKAYVDQKDEYFFMKHLGQLFEIPNVTIRNPTKDYFRVESGSKKVITNFLAYFEKYPLQTHKHRAFAIWKRLAKAWLNDIAYADIILLAKRVQRLQKLNAEFKKVDSVFLLLEERNQVENLDSTYESF